MSSFTIRASVFRDLLAGAMVASGTDATLPTLRAVQLEWESGIVESVATDRYRISHGKHAIGEGESTVESGTVLLDRSTVSDLVKVLPKAPKRGREYAMVTVTLSGDARSVDIANATEGWQRTVPTLMGEFPKWRQLMDTFHNATRHGVDDAAYNPAYLADVAKLPHDPKRPVKMSFTEAHKPCIMTYDMHNDVAWEYVLMPVRLTA